jgi:PAS domain S-box-containing protein
MTDELQELRTLVARQPHLDMLAGALEGLSDPLVIANPEGEICFVNSQTELVFGYDRSELVGKKVDILLPPSLREGHMKFREDFWKQPRVRAMGQGRKLAGCTKAGTEFSCEIMLSPYSTKQGRFVSATIRVHNA